MYNNELDVDEFGVDFDHTTPAPLRPNGQGSYSVDAIHIHARRRRVVRMRLQGYSNEEIAQNLGVAVSTIQADIRQIKQTYNRSSLNDYQSIVDTEVMRLESDEGHLRMMLATEEDTDRALRIYDRVLKTGDARRDVLALKDAMKAARGVPTDTEVTVRLEFDGSGGVIETEGEEIEEYEEYEIKALDMSEEVEIDYEPEDEG